MRVWQLDEVSRCLPQTSSSVVKAAAVVDTSNVLYPTESILLCLKKVKGKDTNPDSAFYMPQAHFSTFENKPANMYVKNLPVYNCVQGRCDDISFLKQQKSFGNLRWGYAYGVLTR